VVESRAYLEIPSMLVAWAVGRCITKPLTWQGTPETPLAELFRGVPCKSAAVSSGAFVGVQARNELHNDGDHYHKRKPRGVFLYGPVVKQPTQDRIKYFVE
jgi:hypothetical protein